MNQVQQLQPLENLAQPGKRQPGLGPSRRLALAVAFLEENRPQLPYFYPDLFQKCSNLFDQILHYPYFRKLLVQESPPASSFRLRVWQLLRRGEELMAEMKQEHDWIEDEARRGTPFPMVVAVPGLPAAPKPA